jgi:hypothetical protein
MEERKTKLKDVLIDIVYFNTMAILCARGLRLTSLKPIARIAGSNKAGSMDVHLLCLLCVV